MKQKIMTNLDSPDSSSRYDMNFKLDKSVDYKIFTKKFDSTSSAESLAN